MIMEKEMEATIMAYIGYLGIRALGFSVSGFRAVSGFKVQGLELAVPGFDFQGSGLFQGLGFRV